MSREARFGRQGGLGIVRAVGQRAGVRCAKAFQPMRAAIQAARQGERAPAPGWFGKAAARQGQGGDLQIIRTAFGTHDPEPDTEVNLNA